MLIKMSIKKLPGIQTTSINSKDKVLSLQYDDRLISKEKIAQQIHQDTGYKVV